MLGKVSWTHSNSRDLVPALAGVKPSRPAIFFDVMWTIWTRQPVLGIKLT